MSPDTPVFDQRTRGDAPSTALEAPAAAPVREPEKLVVPPQAVGDLLMIALRSQEGNAWWRGFVTAHGSPSWIAEGQWALAPGEAAVVRAPRPERNGRA